MTILVDMNLSPIWIPFLAQHGIHAVHWSTIGKATSPDSEILNYAAIEKFVVFTNDLDFRTLLAKRRIRGPSEIQLRTQDLLPDSVGAIVVGAIASCRAQLEGGCIITVDPRQQRIRFCPLISPVSMGSGVHISQQGQRHHRDHHGHKQTVIPPRTLILFDFCFLLHKFLP